MKFLSLFDGMACGPLAAIEVGIPVDRYVAFEIDKYAIQTSSHNFPMIEHRGDVFKADFTEFEGFDILCGGSPCTYWSIAQKNNRETEASGMGWELFSQYVRALNEAKPRFFLYENNKSMSAAIRESISTAFGFEPICINSALVSAQNRNRLYWVGKRNEDGTYSKVDVGQPEDRGILLRDVLESGSPFGTTATEKSFCLTARYYKVVGTKPNKVLERSQDTLVAEPVCVAERGRYGADGIEQHYDARVDGKTNVLTTVSKDNQVCEPVCMRYERSAEAKRLRKQYENGDIKHGFHEHSELHPRTDGKTNTLSTVLKDNPICVPVRAGCFPSPDGTMKNSQAMRLYDPEGKSVNLTAHGDGLGAKTGMYTLEVPTYAEAVEWDENGRPTKAVSYADGKTYPVYEVKAGQISIKDKQYPIKLKDGFYIIRKLTVRECMRLQTVPEWYKFPVSDSQAYRMLGNGWTVEVIAHLLRCIMRDAVKGGEPDVLHR